MNLFRPGKKSTKAGDKPDTPKTPLAPKVNPEPTYERLPAGVWIALAIPILALGIIIALSYWEKSH